MLHKSLSSSATPSYTRPATDAALRLRGLLHAEHCLRNPGVAIASYKPSDWLIPLGLIALAVIPVAGGVVRLVMLAGLAPVRADSGRFIAAPLPVVLHIVSVTIYCVVGAFQFSSGLREKHPRLHRWFGRVLVPYGLVAALSGLWMALTYAIVPADTVLLHVLRLLAGSGMTVCLILGYAAIARGDVETHQGWMRRAYAIGLGAGTQALALILPILLFGALNDTSRTLMMGMAWLLNLGVAEWLIRRRERKRRLVALA